MNAYIFPGQGAQFSGMGKNIYESSTHAQQLFEQANDILGFNITQIMFEGSEDDLKQTKVTQPAVFLHSVILTSTIENFKPAMVAGHSLGEFSALVAAGALSFENGLALVAKRAAAMQRACEARPSSMAAVLNLPDETVVEICEQVSQDTHDIVVAANYNCPGQLVISGSIDAVTIACERMKAAGAKRALVLPVGGAFHSPLMQPAREELAAAIENTNFKTPICPVYQNVDAQPSTDVSVIKSKLITQLTAPVLWTQLIQHMTTDGATFFYECGPGKVLQGLVRKISPMAETASV